MPDIMNVDSASTTPSIPPIALPSTSALSITLAAISASPSSSSSSSSQGSSSTSYPSPSLHAPSSPLIARPRSSSIDPLHSPSHLPVHHQILTPTSTSLTLTSPPTPSSSPSPSPSHLPPPSLASLEPEDRFLPLHISASSPTLQTDLFHLLSHLYFPFLSPPLPHPPVSPSSLLLTPITGGITNSLFRATLLPPLPPTPILVRIFGPSTDQVIDRLTEQRITVALSKSRFGVRLWGHFETGRLEEWLEARPLGWEEMVGLAGEIGETVGELHLQTLKGVVGVARVSPLFSTLVEWMRAAREVNFDPTSPSGASKAALLAAVDVRWWQAELDTTLQLLSSSTLSLEPLVFCHNDLLSGNILAPTAPTPSDTGAASTAPSSGLPRLYLVDLEYASWNFAAFDIANHFLECCGFECQWHRFPTLEQRRTFLRAYLTGVRKGKEGGRGVEEREVDEWDEKVRGFLTLSHLWWGIWAVLQAKHSTISFDYLKYSALRKAGYLLMRQQSWDVLKAHQKRQST